MRVWPTVGNSLFWFARIDPLHSRGQRGDTLNKKSESFVSLTPVGSMRPVIGPSHDRSILGTYAILLAYLPVKLNCGGD